MTIHHLAIWVKNLEEMKTFYSKFFDCQTSSKYHNSKNGFTSFFLSFESGARIELMHHKDILNRKDESFGLAHFAISVGSIEKVDKLTEQIKKDGYTVKGSPRTTGDGYYESVIVDPEGNLVEITV